MQGQRERNKNEKSKDEIWFDSSKLYAMIDLRERIKGLILIKGVNAIERK